MDEQKHRYLIAKVTTDMFKLNPEYLSAAQRSQAEGRVTKILQLQNCILNSHEAQQVPIVSESEIDQQIKKIIESYPSEEEFSTALKRQGLTINGLRHALIDELQCEKVMNSVVKDVPALDHTQALEYYRSHLIDFSRATTWEMSQILITVNEDYPENRRDIALERISRIYSLAKNTPFSELAIQHSECPSAMEHGYLGWCEEGKLYKEISAVLRQLAPEQLSEPVETEIGFHLVKYHQKKAPRVASFDEVLPFLRERHNTRARQFLQKQWINQLINHSSI